MQSDRLNSALGPVVYADIALSINTLYYTVLSIQKSAKDFAFDAPTVWNTFPDEICASPSA